jgi:anti-sigma B factor antagonist
MELTENRIGHAVEISIKGRIDNYTAPVLDEEIKKNLSSPVIWTLILDFAGVEYISSAGIRVLLSAQKHMKANREMIIRNPSLFSQQVFSVTGADIFLKIQYGDTTE